MRTCFALEANIFALECLALMSPSDMSLWTVNLFVVLFLLLPTPCMPCTHPQDTSASTGAHRDIHLITHTHTHTHTHKVRYTHKHIDTLIYIPTHRHTYSYKVKHAQFLHCVWLFVTLWTIVHKAPLSMGFSKQEYWSGLPFPPSGDLPDPGIESVSPMFPALAGRFFTTEPPGKSLKVSTYSQTQTHTHEHTQYSNVHMCTQLWGRNFA